VVVLLLIPFVLWVWMHNSLVSKEEDVFEAWAQVESNYQRRADLVPALVDSVSRYLQHESETLTAITSERGAEADGLSKAIDELIDAQKAAADALRQQPDSVIEDEDKLARLYAEQNVVGRGVSNLLAVAESYPDLRSADQFLELQAQLEGTENRINIARMRFNDAAGEFNSTIRKLPWNLVASTGDFRRKAYFRSEEEARDAPDLGFQ
jgi:LemA protein